MINESETLTEFYRRISSDNLTFPQRQQGFEEKGPFNVYRRNYHSCKNYSPYNRRDFYKISLIIGSGTLYYADRGIKIDQRALLFSNPNVPYAWEAASENQSGYFCVFTGSFVNSHRQGESLDESPLFKVGGNPLYVVNERQVGIISDYFEKMLEEIRTGYQYKHDLIRNYVALVMHEALKSNSADTYFRLSDASTRIVSLFQELLECQFPVSAGRRLAIKSAGDYAHRLSVHTNHLNRAVKAVTGKTTTVHIAERMIQEAKRLLQYTSWNIAEISYCLGFESPSYFNKFFRKQTGTTPKMYRRQASGVLRV